MYRYVYDDSTIFSGGHQLKTSQHCGVACPLHCSHAMVVEGLLQRWCGSAASPEHACFEMVSVGFRFLSTAFDGQKCC